MKASYCPYFLEKAVFALGFWLLIQLPAQGQDSLVIESPLTLAQAMELAQEHNFDIRIAGNDTRISQVNNHPGNAGWLPTVNASASYNYQRESTRAEFINPNQEPIDASGAVTEVYNAGVNANYNLYSGGRRKQATQQLANAVEMSETAQRQQTERVLLNVATQYLQALNAQANKDVAQEMVEVSAARYERVRENQTFGNFTKLQVLNAQVDLRNDSSNLRRAELAYDQQLSRLNNAIGIAPAQRYQLAEQPDVDASLQLNALTDQALNENAAYLMAQLGIKNIQYEQLINQANYLPTLDLSTGYQYSNSQFGANFLRSSRSFGWNAGLTASFTIYNGGRVRRQDQILSLQLENQKLQLAKAENQIRTDLQTAFEQYLVNQELLIMEERNISTAEANFLNTQASFANGQSTGLELRQAQLNLANARLAYTSQQIQTKISEINLLFLSGQLGR